VQRRYGEREIGRILERAAEIQMGEPTAQGPSGMTLRELEEIAAEAGIDPRYLRRAAGELEAGDLDRTFWTRVVGSPMSVALEAVVSGELPESGFERLVPIIQQGTREHGQPSLLGRTLTWQAETASGTRSAMVVVSVRDGWTSIRIDERLHGMAGQLFGGLVGGAGVGAGMGIGMGVGLGALGSALLATAFPVATITIGYVAARELFRQSVERRRRLLSGLLDALVAEVALGIADPTPGVPGSRRHLPEG
jgi:hypothetical protein